MFVTFLLILPSPCLAPLLSILAFHGNSRLSLVRARAAFHYAFDYKPLHFQHIIMMMRIAKMMMIDREVPIYIDSEPS